MSIKFLYHRHIQPPTKEDAARGLNFSFSCKGGVTIGYKWDIVSNKIRLAVARCCDNDNFNRRVARDIVTGRLASNRPHRSTEISLGNHANLTPQKVEDIVWGWLENQERLWDMDVEKEVVH